jgi:transposase-like protein
MEVAVRRTEAEWAKIIEAFKASGQTQASFCREHGISEKTLGAHVRARTEPKAERKQLIKRSTEEWLSLIAEQRESGINRNAWCREHGINADSMTSAEKRLSARIQTSPKPEWVELNPKAAVLSVREEEASWGIRIRGIGLDIEVNTDYPVEKLAILLRNLVKQC